MADGSAGRRGAAARGVGGRRHAARRGAPRQPAPPPPASRKRPAALPPLEAGIDPRAGGGATCARGGPSPLTPCALPFYQGALAHVAAPLTTARFTAASDSVAFAHAGIDVAASLAVARVQHPGAAWWATPRGPVRLVACLVASDTGTPCPGAVPALSDAFIVRSTRALLTKLPIASTQDGVGSLHGEGEGCGRGGGGGGGHRRQGGLNTPPFPPPRPHKTHTHTGVGVSTIARFESLPAASAEAGIRLGLPPDLESVRTVGDLRRLLAHIDASAALDDGVRVTLGLSRSLWGGVKRAAQTAVEPDGR